MEALLNVKDAANLLAVSPWTIRAYIRDGRLRPVRIGRLVRVEQQELERFVLESRSAGSPHAELPARLVANQ
jgi:excisionase family DNA binding protein